MGCSTVVDVEPDICVNVCGVKIRGEYVGMLTVAEPTIVCNWYDRGERLGGINDLLCLLIHI